MIQQGDRFITSLIVHTNDQEPLKWLPKFSYYLGVPVCKQKFIDLTAIHPQQPVPPKPLDLYPERHQDVLFGMADKVGIPGSEKGILAVLVRNDPRRPGEKTFRTVFVCLKQHGDEYDQKVQALQELVRKKGERT